MNEREEYILHEILKAMKNTKEHVKDDFSKAISQFNDNGIHGAVWGRRCDTLVDSFSNDSSIAVFHINRSALWQYDPVFDSKTGILYVMFTEKNIKKIQKKFEKEKDITHYLYSLLLAAKDGSSFYGDEMTFELFDDDYEEASKERRNKDFYKMLGENGELIKDVKVISVDYYNHEAITANLREYNKNFSLRSPIMEISYLLTHKSLHHMHSLSRANAIKSFQDGSKQEDEKRIVKLKPEYKDNE